MAHTKIRLRCPGCHARITAPVELHGQRRYCPGCSTPFIVRASRPQDSDPMLVTTDQEPTRK
ncbi:MAG: hypothetical protein U0797_03710 [Gemmataceae bacterium]